MKNLLRPIFIPELAHVGPARLYWRRSRLRVVVPVQVLQVVGGQDVDVAAAADSRVVDDALGVAALEQALQGFQPFARLFQNRGEAIRLQVGYIEISQTAGCCHSSQGIFYASRVGFLLRNVLGLGLI